MTNGTTPVTPPVVPPVTPPVVAPAAPSFIQNLETQLSADWQGAASFITEAEQFFGSFLTKVSAGAEILITDVESIGQYVAGHLTQITSVIGVFATAASAIAPGNAIAQKVIDDLNAGAQDVALLSNSLASGSTAGDPTIVTQAVTAVGAVKQLSQLANAAGNMLTTLAANSPTATTAVSTPTPPGA